MNTGIIASRYASALLKLVDETGGGETVVSQVEILSNALDAMPDLRRAIGDSKSVSAESKVSLFEAVLGEMPNTVMAPELRKFIELLIRNGRIADCRLVFNSFVSMYYKSRGIVRGRLILPFPAESSASARDLEASLKDMIASKTGKKLLLKTEVDDSLIGGFVLEVEDQLLDASVSHQLEIIKRQFIERNRRIV
ncbi:MAG: ATP synthase F1 subunit delta [Bacteroidales bacterium]|nr:ATP synthase F1 subunit delta [Bacteroidales bacterium]